MNNIALNTINAVRAEISHVNDTGLPLNAFPAKVHGIILDLAEKDNYPMEYTAVAMLSAVSTAIGNTCHIQIKPSWTSIPAMMFILVGEPGQGKTPPLDFAFKPIERQDHARYVKFKEEYQKYVASSEKERADNGMEKLVLIQTVLSDATPESVWRVHNDNQRGIVLLVDEIMGLFNSVTRYNDSPFMTQLLSAYSGKAIKVTRCNNPIPLDIPQPCVNIIGTTQTERIHEFLTAANYNMGMVDRFMFVYPKEVKPTYWSITDEGAALINDKSAEERWGAILTKLLQQEYPACEEGCELKPNVLPLTAEAKRIFYDWHNRLREETYAIRQQGYPNSSRIACRVAKMDTNVARLALCFQMLRWACGESTDKQVDEHSVHCALRMNNFLEESYGRLIEAVGQNAMEPHKKEFLNLLNQSFSTAEAIKAGNEVGLSVSGVKKILPKFVNQKIIIKLSHGQYEKVSNGTLPNLYTLGTFPLPDGLVANTSTQSTPNTQVLKV